MTEKFDKADVDYGKGMATAHCGKMFAADTGYCRHYLKGEPYEGGKCELVNGLIKPSMWCRKFEKAVTK